MRQDTDLPITLRIRNETLGGIVTDSIRYPNGYHDEFRYTARQMAFSILKKNPALLAMDDSADGSFQDFYEDRLNSNYALFDSLIVLINNDLLADALQLVEDINDTNEIEFCLKSVFHIYLNSRISGVDYTSQDTILLDSIAELNAITTGPGVLIARILLNKEIYDYLSSSSRMGSPTKMVVTNPLDIHIYPNPSRNLLFVQPSFLSENFSITIADITGRTLLKKTNQLQIEISSLNSGSYFLVYEAKDHGVVKKFEIIK